MRHYINFTFSFCSEFLVYSIKRNRDLSKRSRSLETISISRNDLVVLKHCFAGTCCYARTCCKHLLLCTCMHLLQTPAAVRVSVAVMAARSRSRSSTRSARRSCTCRRRCAAVRAGSAAVSRSAAVKVKGQGRAATLDDHDESARSQLCLCVVLCSVCFV